MIAVLLACVSLAVAADGPAKGTVTTPLVIVVRLRPGESRTVEFDRPVGGFRTKGTAGRQMVTLRAKEAKDFVLAEKFDQVPGLRAIWEDKLPAVTFTATADAKPGTTDVEVRYTDYFVATAQADHICAATVRVKIEEK